jgi:cardiolipin synthase (CMP-forming)
MRWLPNLLTWARIVLTPVVIYTVVWRECAFALPVTLVAGFTDTADGYFARRFGAETRLGAWLDPIADKFLLVSLYVSFGLAKLVPVWLVWLVVGRDVLILAVAGVAILTTPVRDFPPTVWGKLSTVIQICASVLLVASCSALPSAAALVDAAVWLVAAGTAWSGIHYAGRAVAMFRSVQEKV